MLQCCKYMCKYIHGGMLFSLSASIGEYVTENALAWKPLPVAVKEDSSASLRFPHFIFAGRGLLVHQLANGCCCCRRCRHCENRCHSQQTGCYGGEFSADCNRILTAPTICWNFALTCISCVLYNKFLLRIEWLLIAGASGNSHCISTITPMWLRIQLLAVRFVVGKH